MAAEEIAALEPEESKLVDRLRFLLLPRDPNDDKNVLLEIRAGAGGDEASLFAAEIFRMYSRYAEGLRWKVEVTSASESGAGGVKEVIALINGDKVYSKLKYESGVHRVQRVPVTLALELGARAVGTDLSHSALQVARQNAARLQARVDFVQTDLAAGLAARFDLIVSNPPYIPAAEIPTLQHEVRDHEPHLALLGGEEGTEPYWRIIPQAEQLLKPGGWLIFEIGYRGEAGVRGAFEGRPWGEVTTGYDLAGLPRVLRARFEP